jgi:hypothetical protein
MLDVRRFHAPFLEVPEAADYHETEGIYTQRSHTGLGRLFHGAATYSRSTFIHSGLNGEGLREQDEGTRWKKLSISAISGFELILRLSLCFCFKYIQHTRFGIYWFLGDRGGYVP